MSHETQMIGAASELFHKQNSLYVDEDGKTPTPNPWRLAFMYSGQGSQYYHMGRELYQKNAVFKQHLDHCASILAQYHSISLRDIIYDDTKKHEPFDALLHTHPALFCIGYSLTQVLYHYGLRADAVLGYSLGEYVAATVAGALSLEDGLALVVAQARALQARCGDGGMLVILDRAQLMADEPELFAGCELAAINYDTNFIVSGPAARLREIKHQLGQRSVIAQILPVNVAFHSALVEPARPDFERATAALRINRPRLPLYSAAAMGADFTLDGQHLWQVVRGRIYFRELIGRMQAQANWIFIDLSPNGTLASFVKYGFNDTVPALATINQFGRNLQSLETMLATVGRIRAGEWKA